MITLRFCRVPTPTYFIYENAYTDQETGITYNIDSDLRGLPSKPKIKKDKNGKILSTIIPPKLLKNFREIKRDGDEQVKVHYVKQPGVRPDKIPFILPLDTNARKLVIKMIVNLSFYFKPERNVYSPLLQAFMETSESEAKIIFSFENYSELDSLRLPLSHLIMIEGDSRNNTLYGIVQFYGILQYYLPIYDNYSGPDFLEYATLDPISYEEKFRSASQGFRYRSPKHILTVEESAKNVTAMLNKFNAMVIARFGEPIASFH